MPFCCKELQSRHMRDVCSDFWFPFCMTSFPYTKGEKTTIILNMKFEVLVSRLCQQEILGNRYLLGASVGKSHVLPMQVPNPDPTLDKNLASIGPGNLSGIRVGVWRQRPEAFSESNTILDTFQSVKFV